MFKFKENFAASAYQSMNDLGVPEITHSLPTKNITLLRSTTTIVFERSYEELGKLTRLYLIDGDDDQQSAFSGSVRPWRLAQSQVGVKVASLSGAVKFGSLQ